MNILKLIPFNAKKTVTIIWNKKKCNTAHRHAKTREHECGKITTMVQKDKITVEKFKFINITIKKNLV